jgi:hypothetical protein
MLSLVKYYWKTLRGCNHTKHISKIPKLPDGWRTDLHSLKNTSIKICPDPEYFVCRAIGLSFNEVQFEQIAFTDKCSDCHRSVTFYSHKDEIKWSPDSKLRSLPIVLINKGKSLIPLMFGLFIIASFMVGAIVITDGMVTSCLNFINKIYHSIKESTNTPL